MPGAYATSNTMSRARKAGAGSMTFVVCSTRGPLLCDGPVTTDIKRSLVFGKPSQWGDRECGTHAKIVRHSLCGLPRTTDAVNTAEPSEIAVFWHKASSVALLPCKSYPATSLFVANKHGCAVALPAPVRGSRAFQYETGNAAFAELQTELVVSLGTTDCAAVIGAIKLVSPTDLARACMQRSSTAFEESDYFAMLDLVADACAEFHDQADDSQRRSVYDLVIYFDAELFAPRCFNAVDDTNCVIEDMDLLAYNFDSKCCLTELLATYYVRCENAGFGKQTIKMTASLIGNVAILMYLGFGTPYAIRRCKLNVLRKVADACMENETRYFDYFSRFVCSRDRTDIVTRGNSTGSKFNYSKLIADQFTEATIRSPSGFALRSREPYNRTLSRRFRDVCLDSLRNLVNDAPPGDNKTSLARFTTSVATNLCAGIKNYTNDVYIVLAFDDPSLAHQHLELVMDTLYRQAQHFMLQRPEPPVRVDTPTPLRRPVRTFVPAPHQATA